MLTRATPEPATRSLSGVVPSASITLASRSCPQSARADSTVASDTPSKFWGRRARRRSADLAYSVLVTRLDMRFTVAAAMSSASFAMPSVTMFPASSRVLAVSSICSTVRTDDSSNEPSSFVL